MKLLVPALNTDLGMCVYSVYCTYASSCRTSHHIPYVKQSDRRKRLRYPAIHSFVMGHCLKKEEKIYQPDVNYYYFFNLTMYSRNCNISDRLFSLSLSQIIARVSVDNRTRALVQAVRRASDVRLYISRVEELSYHLLEFPETRLVAVKVTY